MKVILTYTDAEEVELDLPIYCYVEDGNKRIFIRIDENHFTQIVLKPGIKKVNRYKRSVIARYWLEYLTDEEHFNRGLSELKQFMEEL